MLLHRRNLRVVSTSSDVGFVCRSACRFYTPACDKHNKFMCIVMSLKYFYDVASWA
jgi:hypothetical protein